MKKFTTFVASKHTQNRVFVVLSIMVLGMTILLNATNGLLFQRFFDRFNPLILITASTFTGFLLLSYLHFRGWFTLFKIENLKKIIRYTGLIILFVSVSILVDLNMVFQADMNIKFPESLLFYPVIAFFVEILFHVLPLTILLIALISIFNKTSYKKLLWITMLLVALLEPTYQAINMTQYPAWAVIVVWVNLFLFNLTQLSIFKKFDFILMLTFRLLYYLCWHIIWGHIRLQVLF